MAAPRQPNAGILHLTVRRVGLRTMLQDCYSQVPLQILRPLYLDDTGTAYVYLLNPCGGVVGGDRYAMTVVAETGARICLTTPSATRLYATPGPVARQQCHFTLHAGAVLEYLPEQIIPFAEAAFQQQTTVQLGTGACALLMEIVAPGRLLRGEAFAYRDYRSSLRVEDAQGRVVLLERTRLEPQRWSLAGLGLFEAYPYLGTFYALCDDMALSVDLAEHLHTVLASRPRVLGSATTLEYGGLAVRVLGTDHTAVSETLHEVWDVLRQQILGYPAVIWRK